ncbi:UNVERIFIED_CONTAM: hypothetical protein Slati_2909100 [Sesamum latifolium]|uniref:Integrase zinc-binding domain-containing protein n=1 Tax=Sesamum latifolium TaxID=2727402 RepID=A0AAW2VDM3_9LAMI
MEDKSWKSEIEEYLLRGTEPDDPIIAKRLKFRANRFTMMNGELYRRSAKGSLVKCLSPEKAQYVHREIHEGSNNHSGGRSLAQKVIRQGYFWPTLVKGPMEFQRNVKAARSTQLWYIHLGPRWNTSRSHVHSTNGG